MTIEELAEISCVKVSTIRNNASSVIGFVEDESGNISFPASSRYPYDAHRYKFDNIGKRRLALLDATYRLRYIDHQILKMTQESFNTMLEELLRAGYLQKNHGPNTYGANQYDTTMEYELLHNQSKSSWIKSIADKIGSASGHFAGAYASEINS